MPLIHDADAPVLTEAMSVGETLHSRARTSPRVERLGSIDQLRGFVILLMALDHVRDYFTNAQFEPTDLQHTTAALFFTRWITHFCAPTFIFLAGVSARLMSERKPRAALSKFLLTRGLWLVVLEITVVTFAWTFNFKYQLGLILQVIWATGISMCMLAALIWLPAAAVGVFGVAMIAAHNLLDPIKPESFGTWAPLWKIIHVQGEAPFGLVLYPLVPWIGVMAAGYGFGAIYRFERARRVRILWQLGLGLCVLFVVVRGLNGYGDPHPWSQQRDALFTALSFFNVTKYPPSLAYVAMTLGPALLALAWLDLREPRPAKVFETFGRVPLFAYVVHIALAHLLAGVLGLVSGYGASTLTTIFVFYPKGWGVGLPGVYLAWLAVLAVLYPLCRWFAGVKRARSDWWLSYL